MVNECTVYKLIKLSLLVDEECKRGLWKCKETWKKKYWNIPLKMLDFLIDRYDLGISKSDIRKGDLGTVSYKNGTASIKKPMYYLDQIC